MSSVDISTLEQLKNFAEQQTKQIQSPKIFALYGNLGSGKTTLVQMMSNQLGVQEQVTSPTYSLVNHYNAGDLTINHLDLYRLHNLEEAFSIGIEDILYQDAISFIEWPEIIDEILPEDTIKFYFSTIDNNRYIDYEQ